MNVDIGGVVLGVIVGIILIFLLGVAGVVHGATGEVEKNAEEQRKRRQEWRKKLGLPPDGDDP